MTCLSDLYYKIGYWFTVVMFAIAIVTLPFALEAWDSIWSFLMCAGIAFVGAAPDYKGSEHDIHYVSALTSMTCSSIWVSHVMPQCFYLLFIVLASVILDTRRWLLWCELGCFVMVYLALYLT